MESDIDEKIVKLKRVVTLPKIKKTVHNVMVRYGENRFYRKIDLIEKVLYKLQLQSTLKEKQRIRSLIKTWIQENKNSTDSEMDSKKGIIDNVQVVNELNKLKNLSDQVSDSENKEFSSTNKNNESKMQQNNIKENNVVEKKTTEEKEIVNILQEAEIIIPPVPNAIPISSLKKRNPILLIDLTIENKIKKDIIEIDISDDDDDHQMNFDNAQIDINKLPSHRSAFSVVGETPQQLVPLYKPMPCQPLYYENPYFFNNVVDVCNANYVNGNPYLDSYNDFYCTICPHNYKSG